MTTKNKSAIEDLYKLSHEGKAELVDGEIVLMSPTGDMPSRAAFNIAISLREMEGNIPGRAYANNIAYRVELPNRGSLSPDASFYTGERAGMRFLEGAPVFAVEVRSENDYGANAEAAIAKKRADYFAAGTLVVWDVDLLAEEVVRSYDSRNPTSPRVFRRGEVADAELAVPGWRILVDSLFE